jgi:hypothetical protein
MPAQTAIEPQDRWGIIYLFCQFVTRLHLESQNPKQQLRTDACSMTVVRRAMQAAKRPHPRARLPGRQSLAHAPVRSVTTDAKPNTHPKGILLPLTSTTPHSTSTRTAAHQVGTTVARRAHTTPDTGDTAVHHFRTLGRRNSTTITTTTGRYVVSGRRNKRRTLLTQLSPDRSAASDRRLPYTLDDNDIRLSFV